MTTMMKTRFGRGSTEMSRELEEIRLLNKRNHQQECQRKEEEEKREKDKDAIKILEVDAVITTADVPVTSQEGTEDEDVLNFSEDVHNIMNSFEEMGTEDREKDAEDERSPRKKRPGSSKVSSRQSSTTARQVSPPDPGAAPVLKPALRTPSFVDTVNRK
jgi:hypothetical protein